MYYSADLEFYENIELEGNIPDIIMICDKNVFYDEFKKRENSGVYDSVTEYGHHYTYFNTSFNGNRVMITYEIDDIYLSEGDLFGDMIGMVI